MDFLMADDDILEMNDDRNKTDIHDITIYDLKMEVCSVYFVCLTVLSNNLLNNTVKQTNTDVLHTVKIKVPLPTLAGQTEKRIKRY